MPLGNAPILCLLAVMGCTASPSLLECANDTSTRLRVGGKAIMAGPPVACGSDCKCALALADGPSGTKMLTITTSAAVNFAVRVSDGAGSLASEHAVLAAKCDGQMYSGPDAPPPGTFTVVLTPAAGANQAPVFTVGYTDKFGDVISIVTYPPSPSPPPSPPPSLYTCSKGQCVASTSGGVDLPACKQLCKAPAPSPPPSPPSPPSSLYKCSKSQCVASTSGGVDLPTCEQLCKAPAPSPPGPSAFYRCAGNQCVASTTGVSIADCQQICHAPSPPAPAPKPKSCKGQGCVTCLFDYVLQILEAVEQCLTLKIVKCTKTSVTDIRNLIAMIATCFHKKSFTDSLEVYKLWQLAFMSGDAQLQSVATDLQRALNTTWDVSVV